MSKEKDKFFKQINEMIMTRKYNDDAMEKLLNMIVGSKRDRTSRRK